MTIPSWRLALAGGSLVVLGAIGGSLVEAAANPATTTASTADAGTPITDAAAAATVGDSAALLDALGLAGDPSPNPAAAIELAGLRDRLQARLAGLRQRLVHGTLIVRDRDGKLVTIQLDHGTVSAVGAGSITIAEAGSASVTVATNADTRVRKDRKPATLGDLKVGDEVVVDSIVSAGSATAKLIVVPPKSPAAIGAANTGNG